MKNRFFVLTTTLLLIFGLPLLGLWAFGKPVSPYLAFPPARVFVPILPFSKPVFIGLGMTCLAFVVLLTGLILWRVFRFFPPSPAGGRFPLWGWAGIFAVGLFWYLAWTRYSWFSFLQPHTFPLLWAALIVVFNALTKRKAGRCRLTHQTGFFFLLFPISAAFWWTFEYLNRFVQNWVYSGSTYQAWTYFCLASISFSTVLPAFLSVRDWLMTFNWLSHGFYGFLPIHPEYSKPFGWVILILSVLGLLLIGVFPGILFPILWMAPFLLIISLQILTNQKHILTPVSKGDWTIVMASLLAGIICGLFWETWNFYSLAKWTYRISLVYRFKLFEMPILGYSGYLPFGLGCAVVIKLIRGQKTGKVRE